MSIEKSKLKHISIALIVCVAMICVGCSRTISFRHKQPCLKNKICASRIATVRTGGELNSIRTFTVDSENPLTLRRAIIESGGIREPKPSFDVPFGMALTNGDATNGVLVAPQTNSLATEIKPSNSAGSVGSAKAATNGDVPQKDSSNEDLDALRSILSSEQEMGRLLALNSNFQFGSFTPPVGDTVVAYLQSAVESIGTSAAFNEPAFDTNLLRGSETDRDKLLDMLILVFKSSSKNNQKFADDAIKTLERLKSATPGAKQRSALPSQPMIFASAPQNSSYLIGLENIKSKETIYLHPQLIFRTAVGDVQLTDGDFVFAVRADETSLPLETNVRIDYPVKVLGITEEADGVNLAEFNNIASVLSLQVSELQRRQEVVSHEHISVLRRSTSGTLRSEVFYIPVDTSQFPMTSSNSIPLGSVRPGDSFLFTYASRSPIVYDRIISPIKTKLADKNKLLLEESQCRSKLPAGGNYLSNAAANWNYYTQPIAQRARNIVR